MRTYYTDKTWYIDTKFNNFLITNYLYMFTAVYFIHNIYDL